LGRGWGNANCLQSKAELPIERWLGFFIGGKEGDMKKLLVFLSFMLLFFVVLGTAHSTLQDRGGGLIYDDVLDITWLQNANYTAIELTDARRDAIISEVGSIDGHTLVASDFVKDGSEYTGQMTWWGAMAWADSLIYCDSVRDITWTDWRLPQNMPVVGISYQITTPSYDGSTDRGNNISAPDSAYPGSTTSEMAYM
jgi:hypothetical protein